MLDFDSVYNLIFPERVPPDVKGGVYYVYLEPHPKSLYILLTRLKRIYSLLIPYTHMHSHNLYALIRIHQTSFSLSVLCMVIRAFRLLNLMRREYGLFEVARLSSPSDTS